MVATETGGRYENTMRLNRWLKTDGYRTRMTVFTQADDSKDRQDLQCVGLNRHSDGFSE